MTAWENLKALSALAVGTAWQLITSPKLSGSGVIVNDGIEVEVADVPISAELAAEAFAVEIAPASVVAEVADLAAFAELAPTATAIELNTNPLEMELP